MQFLFLTDSRVNHDNVKHFETTSIGCKLSDNDTTAALQFANSTGDNGYVMEESTNIIGLKIIKLIGWLKHLKTEQ